MLKRTVFGALALAVAAGACFAQNPDETKFYKLDFVLKEVEGSKVLNSRSYSMLTSTITSGPTNSIRTGTRVPLQGGVVEVGVSIDCRSIKETSHGLALSVTADISSLPADSSPGVPAVRQNKWTSNVIVPMKKPTVIFAADDTTSKRQMQLEVIATPIS